MHYRLYVLDENARIVRGVDLDCSDDAQAIAAADGYRVGHGVEIWQQRVKVASLRPVQAGSAAVRGSCQPGCAASA